jgi:uncharacterized protein
MELITATDWNETKIALDRRGFFRISSVLSEEECEDVKGFYGHEELFRSTIDMQRYRFGMGEYKYLKYPLPPVIQRLRSNFYSALVPVANEWMQHLGLSIRYPDQLETFLSLCHSKDQQRPTPLILRYEADGYNTLHQDIYGEVFFPFQVVFMLSKPGIHFEGGELVFVEQLPRAQSRAEVITINQGDAIIFTTNFRPVKGMKGYYRASMRHGVSPVKSGLRYTMGLIFHDAR